MSDIGEGLGSAIEGGLIARAIEGKTGAKERGEHDPENCLNCDTALVGAYCHACGQSGHVHRSMGAFMHDLLHGALHFEGKIWRTLPMLVLRPGKLTKSYIEGARARFVSPMALFLFAVFLMFAAFQMLGITAPADLSPQDGATQEASQVINEAIAEAEPQGTVDLRDIDFIGKKLIGKWEQNPSLMLYKLQANSYKFSWLLIPLSVPFIWALFFWKRRFKGYDHAIFVTYSLSFMTLLFVALSALGVAGVPDGVLVTAALLIPPVHIYKQLRGAYSLSRFSAIWRLIALSCFILVIAVLFLQILLLLGAS